MAGTLISDYATGTKKWSQLLTTIEKQRKGYNGVSLTNYDNSSLPAIAAGSYVEISGALYGFTSEEAITGTPTSGSINYIYVDGTTFVPVWATTAPIWSNAKNGWYDTGETNRYIGGCYYDGTDYTTKFIYNKGRDNIFKKIIEIGDWNMDATAVKYVDHGFGSVFSSVIRTIDIWIRSDDGSECRKLETFFDSNDPYLLAGGIYRVTSSDMELYRRTGGYFDSIGYDATAYNRGWVTIWYEV